MPARKNRNTSPICDSTLTASSTSAMSSTSGPIRMPATISTTIVGTFGTGSRSISSGASMAAATTISRFSYSSPWIVRLSHSLVRALR